MTGAAKPSRISGSGASYPEIRLVGWLQAVATALLLVPASILAIAVVGFATGHGIGPLTLPLGVLLSVILLRLFLESWRETATVAILSLVLTTGSGAIASAFPDGSWDGLAYQQEGVIRLAMGWNPFTEAADDYGDGAELYLNHYPKGPWIPAASVLRSTGRVEAGKLFNLTLGFAAFGMVAVTLFRLTSLGLLPSMFVAALAALNPVFIGQALTFYVDGMLGQLLALLAAALAMYVARPHWRLLVIAAIAICLIINVKFTGIGYAGAIGAIATIAVWRRYGSLAMARLASAGLAAAIIGFVGIGYAPYVRNTVDKGGPFYPISPAPPDRADSLAHWRPANLWETDRVTRFLVSNFSESESVRPPRASRLKIPFTVSADERSAVYGPDLEVGGFGPFFGGALLLVGLLAAALLFNSSTRSSGALALAATGAIFASVLVHSETWWARFVPQAWLLVVPLTAVGLSLPRRTVQWGLAAVCTAVVVVNTAFVGINAARRHVAYRKNVVASLRELTSLSRPVAVYLDTFPPLRKRLQEAGIEFTIVTTPPEPSVNAHVIPAPGNQALWFVPAAAR